MRDNILSLRQIIEECMKEDKVWASPSNLAKEARIRKLTSAFTDYITELGIDPRNLKVSSGKYSILKHDADFIKDFFRNYTSQKNREIRAKKRVLSAEEITRWLKFIENTMSINGKNHEEIQIQYNTFYRVAKPDRREMVDSIVDEIRPILMNLADEVDNEQFALPTDKELVLELMRLCILRSVRDNIETLGELLFYFHEVRTEDISDYGIASEKDSQLAAYNEATFALNRLYRQDECYCDKMKNLTEMIERCHATDQSHRVKLMSEIEKRKKELCEQIAEKSGLDFRRLWNYSQADKLKSSEDILQEFFTR